MADMLNVIDRQTKKKTAILQNAFDIVETKELNKIYSLQFTLPADDEKTIYCQPRHFVRYGDKGELYRIIKPVRNDNDISTITYECEHVIATLCDNVMFGSYTCGGWEMKTAAVIEWLLSKQTEINWVLDECDFDRRFEYGWEQENILNALYAIPKEFASPYQWVFDTTVYPWRLSLKIIDDTIHPEYYLRAKRNLLSSGVSENYADICTRLYPLGYGEGVNQLNIKEVNNGIPYLQSPDNIVAQYGLVEKVLVDRRFENAESLKAYAQTMLDGLQTPSMSRSFDVVDLYPLTDSDLDKAEVGKIVKMVQDDTIAYITKTRRQLDKAGDLQIDLSTKSTDIASTIADLADRVRIESVYAQGATQLYQHSKDANATPDKGMTLSLYFPSEMRQINKVLLKLNLKRFRSYSATTDAAGATKQTSSAGGASTYTSTDGGASTQTSSSGGGVQSSSVSQSTISANVTSGPSSIETTKSGGAGSDLVTSKTPLTGNTGYIELVTAEGGAITNHQTTKTLDVEKETSESGGVTNHQTTKTLDVEKETSESGGVTNHQTTKTLDVEKETTSAGGVTNHQTTKTLDVTLDTTSNGGVTNHQTTKTLDVDLNTSSNGGVTNHQTTKTLDVDLNTSSNGGVTNHQTTKTLDYEKETTSGGGGSSDYTGYSSFDIKNSSTTYANEYTSGAKASIWCDYAGSHSHNLWAYTGYVTPPASQNYYHQHAINYTGGALEAGNHNHGLGQNDHYHYNYHYHSLNLSSVGSHRHSVSVPSHTHKVTINGHLHTITISNHNHTVKIGGHLHTITIPNHNHTVKINGHLHTVTIPNHTHKYTINGHLHTVTIPNHTHKYTINSHLHTVTIPDHTHKYTINSHLHTITVPAHTHEINKHRHYFTINEHSHTINKSLFAHTHGMNHTHNIELSSVGAHTHTFSIGAHSHTVNIPAHSHKVTTSSHTHTVEIPSHTHKIIAGIFESGNPNSFDIYVNNTKKATVEATSYNDDITAWLLNDQNQIPRDSWIDLEIRPNDLAYVVSTVFVQGFVQSRGGGNY